MAKSLFHKDSPEPPSPTPYDLIGKEIDHLKKKGTSVRHGTNVPNSAAPWVIFLAICVVVGLYIMDPVFHAWDKGDAVRVYLYLHSYGTGPTADKLVATGIFSPDEVDVLNRRTGVFQNYYVSPQAATHRAEAIIQYMNSVKLLQAGKYEQLDPVGKMRYELFVRWGIFVPTQWTFLDPTIEDKPAAEPPPPDQPPS